MESLRAGVRHLVPVCVVCSFGALIYVGNVAFVATLSSVLSGISLMRCVQTDAGRIPDSWATGTQDTSFRERPTVKVAGVEYYRPDRASEFGILRFDHTNKWLGGTHIGARNIKFYVLFVFYGMVTSLCGVTWSSAALLQEFAACQFLLFAGSICAFIAFGIALVPQLVGLVTNSTSAERPMLENPWPWDVGVVANVSSVMGEPLYWLVPHAARGDGISFKLNPEWFPSAHRKGE